MKIQQAFTQWLSDIKPEIIRQYGIDTVALSESWNDYTDSLNKDGELSSLQYHYCPAWDDDIPSESDELEWLLGRMQVSIDCTSIVSRPDGNGEWSPDARHWKVSIKRNNVYAFTLFYSMGPALKGEPAIDDVFYCLLSDTSDIEGCTFEEWADNLGYDSDSRKAERTFEECKQTLISLQGMFTKDELTDLRELFEDY